MDLSRIGRIVRARWWVVLATAVLGAAGGLWFASYTNTNVEPRFGASAVIEFILPAEEAAPSRASSAGSPAMIEAVENALPVAEEANAELLESPGFLVVSAPNAGTLTFQAQAPSEETAISIATEMRDNYIAIDPTVIDVDAELAKLVDERDTLNARLEELAALAPVPAIEEPLGPGDTAELAVLDSQIATVTGRVAELEDERFESTDEERIAEIDAELGAIRLRLAQLNRQRNRIDPPEPEQQIDPTTGAQIEDLSYLTAAQQLEKSAAETRLLEINTEYTDLLATDTSLAARYDLQEVGSQDMTPAPISPVLGGVLGLLVGAIIGIAGLMFTDRMKGTVWTSADMENVPLLAEVPGSHRRGHQARDRGVQTVRSAVLGIAQLGGPTTIGFTGLAASDEDVSDLVLDVARSLAGVGRTVLVVDGQIGAQPLHRDLMSGSTLAELDTHSIDDTSVALGVVGVIDRATEVAPNLWIVPGDPSVTDPVDVLASKAFRELTDQAIRRFDIVMVVGPSALSPFAYVMAGSVSSYVVVATVGKTRQEHVEQIAKQFSASRSRLVGLVLLGGRPRRGFEQPVDLGLAPVGVEEAAATPVPVEESEQTLLERLGESIAAWGGDDNER